MNPEEQRVAIAEACGWKKTKGKLLPMEFKLDTEGKVWTLIGTQLPDYLNDLNAMAEAEKMLDDDQRWEQIKILTDWRPAPAGFPLLGRFQGAKLLESTAAQRAEAFLKAIGKWEGGEP